MPKRSTKFTDNNYYHLFNINYANLNIFKDKKDYSFFLNTLKFYKQNFGIFIDTYSILEDHYHFIVKQLKNGNVKKFISNLQLSFAIHYNRKHQRRGPVFIYRYGAREIQGRDDLERTRKYVLENPSKAKIKMSHLDTGISFSEPDFPF